MAALPVTTACSAAALSEKLAEDARKAEEDTPSTSPDSDEASSHAGSSSSRSSSVLDEDSAPRQLQAGVYHDPVPASSTLPVARPSAPPAAPPQAPSCGGAQETKFELDETFFIFDWDDTVLPSTWVQRQGLRLDAGSTLNAEQREVLAEVSVAAGKTLRAARQHGTVVLVTNAERGWIELSCQKFLPTLAPMLENVKLVSARTTYEGAQCPSPLDWKLRAFDSEIMNYFGSDVVFDQSKRKNVLSLGDSAHEREALLRATSSAPNCHSKSLKFVERPDISQICKQHELITNCFDRIVHHEGNLDLCIRCP